MKPFSKQSAWAIPVCLLWLSLGQAAMASNLYLEGQNKGDTVNWNAGNLVGWQELDYIPCRVRVEGGPVANQVIALSFPHLTGTTPGFQDFYTFTNTPNVQIVSGPTLTGPPGGTWTYTMTVTVTDGNSAAIGFFARLAAGAHINVGSSLMIDGSPQSMGQLQVHKPQSGPGLPDLAVVKTGPASATQGNSITYTLSYTNQATGTNTGVGVQISDILPTGVVVVTNSLPSNASVAANTIFFDLTNVAPQTGGTLNFQVLVPFSIPAGTVLTNFAQILESQDDANMTDNTSRCTTLVLAGCTDILITNSPESATNCPGTPVTFAVGVSNSATPLSYQWRKGGNPISGATNNSYSIASVTANDAGSYDVIITNGCSIVTSTPATLTVNANVNVSTAPVSITNCPGTTASFGVSATGTGLSYQWYRDASLLNGETGSTLTINNVSAANAGAYSVVVSGVCGNAITNSASLTVNANVNVSSVPVSITNCPGTTANFDVNATGTGLSYQWYKGASLLNGEIGSTLTINNVSAANSGTYSVVVSGVCGNAITNSASLTVNANVNVSSAPVSITNCPGTTASFSVSASGTGLSYQWYNGASLLNGQTGSTLTINNVSAANAGTYSVVVSGVCGNAITNSASLTVNANVNVSTAPVSITNCPGTTASFSVSATGTGLSYQWYNGASLLNGETGSTLTINNVSAANAGTYSVVVSGVCGNAITNSALLVVNQNVSVAPLSGATKNIGDSFTFTAVASGTGPFSYQWYKGLSPLAGQTNSTLTLTNLQPSDAATYGVSVSGACGEAATSSAVLVLNQPPIASITTPTNNAVFVAPATFTVIASASDPDGTVTNVEFFVSTNGVDFTSLGSLAQGPYSVVVSNLMAGNYSFKAVATDNYGATGESTLVNVSVISSVPFARGAIHFTTAGYDAISLTVTNPTPYPYAGLRIYVSGVSTNSAILVNASGTANGEQYIEVNAPVAPGVTVFTDAILYYVKVGGFTPNPTIRVEIANPNPTPGGLGSAGPTGTPQAIDKGSYLNNGTFALQFTSVVGGVYYVQYTSDLSNWKTVVPPITANATKTLWVDSGPPATESFPSLNNTRYYRVIRAQ